VTPLLPEALKQKALSYPESSYGATRVTLVLSDGRRVKDVYLAWGDEIVKVGLQAITHSGQLGFEVGDIIDVLHEG
jgi:hypothetical protein